MKYRKWLTVLFSCRVRGDWFQVPCKNGKPTVRWLGEEALKRYLKLRPPSFVPNRDEVVSDIRKTLGRFLFKVYFMTVPPLKEEQFLTPRTRLTMFLMTTTL